MSFLFPCNFPQRLLFSSRRMRPIFLGEEGFARFLSTSSPAPKTQESWEEKTKPWRHCFSIEAQSYSVQPAVFRPSKGLDMQDSGCVLLGSLAVSLHTHMYVVTPNGPLCTDLRYRVPCPRPNKMCTEKL
ncbi:conserved hypothetical protein [Coccidioides posadasii str. Silveira]|uniref:Uncharacterized protein n=1 Tax=Coccidioides posadasii (strain RMSCC 757 / Silveira) TaxID=443226 RepID=E9CT76_COCPS|nr:conserved hypothetical protein [Coccidioides posadasii str. Silveira]